MRRRDKKPPNHTAVWLGVSFVEQLRAIHEPYPLLRRGCVQAFDKKSVLAILTPTTNVNFYLIFKAAEKLKAAFRAV